MGNQSINKPRGTLDLIGKNYWRYKQAIDILTENALNYGCTPIQVPVFEESGLFLRSVGKSSDIVRKQTFDLANKGSAKDYTLRPEFTAGIVRAVIENKLYASPDLPLRFVYSGTVYRYERPGTGRLREFRQFGVEFFDTKLDFSSQAEVLMMAYTGAKKILNRELLLTLNYLGGNQARANYKTALIDYFSKFIDHMCDDCKDRLKLNPLRILDCKVPEDQQLVKGAPKIENFLSDEDKAEFDSIKRVLQDSNIPIKVDDRLVRGLDYYTGTVFEIEDPQSPEFGAVGGGGKYAGLMEQLGGPNMEGIGFSYGVDRLLGAAKDAFQIHVATPDFFVMPMAKKRECQEKAFLLASKLRSLGYSAVTPTFSKGVGGAFKMADRLGCLKALLVNEDLSLEVKDLVQRSQTKITEEELLKRGK